MSASECLGAKAKAGLVNKGKAKAARDRMREIYDALVKDGEPGSTAAGLAADQYQKELAAAARRSEWRMINRVRVMRGLQEAVAKSAPTKMGDMAAKMVDDIDFEARSIHKRVMGMVGTFLEKQRVTLAGKVRDPAAFREVIRALKGETTTDAAAREFADAIDGANEWMRKKLNSYGYSIGKLDGWGLPHSHNAIAIGNRGFDGWVSEIDKRLDWAGMINPKTGLEFGNVPSTEFRREFLDAVYRSIVYGRNSKAPKWAQSAAGGAIERHRVFKFKDSDSWLEYNQQFGSSDPHSTLLQHFDQMSRHIALARHFGPDAETALDYMGDLIAQRAAQENIGGKAAGIAQGKVKWAKGMVRVVEGGIGPNGWWGAQSARFFSTTRKALSAALLDRAVVISIPSDMNSVRLAAKAIGMNKGNVLSTYTNLLNDAAKGGGATHDDLLRAQWVLESWANPGVATSRFQQEYPSAAWAEKLSNASMRIQGMNAHTDAAKMAWQWGMAAEMMSQSGRSFSDLDPLLSKAMADAGITPDDWDTFRSSGGVFEAGNGAKLLTPLYWRTANDMADKDAADELAHKMQTFVEKWTELAVPSRSLMAQGVMDPKAYGLAPGSLPYEVIKSGGMFKSFVGAFVVNQARLVNMKPTGGAKAAYVAEMVASMTVVGALAIQVNELLMGRDPQPMDEQFVLRAMLRGGGLGPVGDILSAGTASWGGGIPSYIAGPIPQVLGDATKLTFGNLAQAANQALDGDDIDVNLIPEIMRFSKRYMPLAQTPLAVGGSGFDRLIADQFQLLLDPDSAKDMLNAAKRRSNLYGNEDFWLPGAAAPHRAPDLSAIGL